MDFDDLGLEKLDVIEDEWRKRFASYGPSVVTLASKYRHNEPCIPVNIFGGSFNFCIQVRFDDGVEWVLRFPIPGRVMRPEEKIRQEVATMRFIKERTSIPVPGVVAFGMAEDNPMGLGPFLITEFVKGRPLGEVLQVNPSCSNGKILNPDIEDSTLVIIYKQIANILLELSEHDFDKIGSLALAQGEVSWTVESRPLTLKINEVERCGNLTLDDHLEPFETVTDYINHLATQNLVHLHRQRNCVDDADDARRKYICRRLLQLSTSQFVSERYDRGPFKLFCDDFRPGNILVDEELQITAVLDWEWCYAAPYQFLYSPPRWLLLKSPVDWQDSGLEEEDIDLLNVYMPKFELFVRVLEEQEEERMEKRRKFPGQSNHAGPQRMSTLMRQSMADGTFWFNEAVRQSYSLDQIWWSRLNELCLARGDNGIDREEFLSSTGFQKDLDGFVRLKMKQREQYNNECASTDKIGAEIEQHVTGEQDNADDGQITRSSGPMPTLFPQDTRWIVSMGVLIVPVISYYSLVWLRRYMR